MEEKEVKKEKSFNYFAYLLSAVLKPKTTFEKEKEELKDTKNAMILALIVSGGMTILNFINTIFNTVRYKTYSFTEGYKTAWDFNRIKNINLLEVIGKNFLIYIGIIFAIAGIFYIGSLIIKKETNFLRLLSSAATSMVPLAICSLFIGPILGLIWSDLNYIVMLAGMAYTLSILYNLLNIEIKLDGDIKVYFYAICSAILLVIGYFVVSRILISAITKGFGL